jgi:phosphoesterase RecJ-like protein
MLPNNQVEVVNQLKKLIDKGSRFLVAAHMRPDGDATGSVGGFVKALRKYGKKVDIAFLDKIPENFAFTFPDKEYLRGPEIETDHDAVFILDSGDDGRTGLRFKHKNSDPVVVNIDHHASNTYFGTVNYVDTSASSTCEMIVALLDHCKIEMDADVAISLFLGLLTDSRFFQNEGLRHTAHLAAATLLRTGVDTTPILNTLNCSRAEADLRVQGYGLSNFKLEADGKLATLKISWDTLQSLNANFGNVFGSGIFNSMTSMNGVVASVTIFENAEKSSFCEFRSKGGFNVKEVAVSMGGGGHIPASGCNKNEPLEQVAEEAISKLKVKMAEFVKTQKG